MLKKNTNPFHRHTTGPDKMTEPVSVLNRPVWLALLVFIILSLLFTLLIFQRYQLAVEAREKEAYEIVHETKEKLQEALTHSLSATKTLSFFIDRNGQVSNFDSIAEQILQSGTDIDALQLVPGGVISNVYPLAGNEKALGYNILMDPARSKEAFKAIEKKQMFFAGPLELKQGGIGVVGRLPVYRNNKFWGFSAVVIRMSTLFRTAGIDSAGKDGFYFQLSKVNPDTKKEEFFLPKIEDRPGDHQVSVKVPDGEWKLSVTNLSANRSFGDLALLALLGFLLSVLGAVFVYRFAIRPKKLNELVLNRTRELKNSENNYRSLIERVSDAFIAVDKNWTFTYVNEKAGEILGKKPEQLIGESIWEEFPEAVDKSFYQAYYRAMQKQEYQYLEDYYPPLDKWLENHIYPSKDGLTILFKDVTDIKQITLALKNKEEKYRTLIEQASDGIVITDMEGIILEVNKSMMQMIGYAEEEMIGFHLTSYLPDPDITVIPLRINELMQGKSLLYERRLVKRDGTVIDVEINSKMASSHTLIGFIRDITERKKHENTLVYQARLLESVSDAITSLDINRRIVSWNRACQDLYGFTAEEVIGRNIPDLVTFEYPNSTNEAVFKQVFEEGTWRGEFDFIHPKTKEKINLLSSINLLKNKDGEISGFIITSNNITDRKKVEEEIRISNERFALIAEATNDAVWDHDFSRNETWGNKKLYKLYGLGADEKINFEMFLDHIGAEEREAIVTRMKEAIDNSVSSLSETFLFKAADGDKIFFDRAYIKYDENGKPARILGAMQDITEREKIKEQILKEKELSDSIINSLPGIFYLYNKNGKFLRWNKNFETVTGYHADEIAHMHPLDFFEEEIRQVLADKIAKVFASGYDNVEANFLVKGGSVIPYYFTGQAIEYEGEPCLMGVGLDFSEKVKNERMIRSSEEKFRTIIEQANDGIFISDEHMYMVDVNSAGCRMLGYTAEELQQLKFIELIPPEDLPGNPIRIEDIDKGESVVNERRVIRKDGTILDVEISAKKLLDGRYQSFIRDITERKKAGEILQQSEKKYKLLFYNNPQAMFMATIPGLDIIDVNEAAVKQYGYSREEFLQMNTRALRPAEDVEAFVQEMAAMETGITNRRNWRHKRKDGTLIQVETYSHQIVYEGKKVWLGLIHDVTEKLEAKEMLQRSYEDIRQLASNLQTIREHERTNIAREIHDELGQQLTGLKMDLHWLSRKINSSDEEVAAKMKESIELINATITSVRKISTDLRPSILDDLGLLSALEWQGEEFEKRSGTKVIFVNEAGDIELDPHIATGIFRIYQELLTNIARHANAAEVRTVLKRDDNRLYFSINDNGVGFDPETIKNKKTLGLLGIKERTLLFGGTYEFKSKPGEGSVTIISIPLQSVNTTI